MVVVFDTNMGGNQLEKSVKKKERIISEKIPGLKLITSGLPIRIRGMKDPVAEGELAKSKEFRIKIATQLIKYNDVNGV